MALIAGVLPCLIVVLPGKIIRRFAAAQMSQIIVVFLIIVLTICYDRMNYLSIGLSLSILALACGIVLTRFLERWI
jgi:multisubunit Na+/H+ antiporter MnhF subunit